MSVRRLRLLSGLVLFVYITLHLINHALGIWSLDLAEAGLTWALRLWRSPLGTVMLYGAALVHFTLACRTVYERRHWRLPLIEWIRLWAGFSLPLLLIHHVVTTRIAALYGVDASYGRVVGMLRQTRTQGWQMALLAPGWLHGCLGLWLTLRRYALMQRLRPFLIGIVIMMPLLAAWGFIAMSRDVAQWSSDIPSASLLATLTVWRHDMLGIYLALIGGAFGAGMLRNRLRSNRAE
jgi:adenylate cyclase